MAGAIESCEIDPSSCANPRIRVNREHSEISVTYCSPNRLSQVLMDALKNVAQASEGSGTFEVNVFEFQGSIFARIRDSGIGITPEQLERIFELRFNPKISRVKMGSGLSMAYRIIRDHLGQITVASEVGAGTEVAVRLTERSRDADGRA